MIFAYFNPHLWVQTTFMTFWFSSVATNHWCECCTHWALLFSLILARLLDHGDCCDRRAALFGKQHWVTGEYQTKVHTLIHKQTENRLGMLEVLFVLRTCPLCKYSSNSLFLDRGRLISRLPQKKTKRCQMPTIIQSPYYPICHRASLFQRLFWFIPNTRPG